MTCAIHQFIFYHFLCGLQYCHRVGCNDIVPRFSTITDSGNSGSRDADIQEYDVTALFAGVMMTRKEHRSVVTRHRLLFIFIIWYFFPHLLYLSFDFSSKKKQSSLSGPRNNTEYFCRLPRILIVEFGSISLSSSSTPSPDSSLLPFFNGIEAVRRLLWCVQRIRFKLFESIGRCWYVAYFENKPCRSAMIRRYLASATLAGSQ